VTAGTLFVIGSADSGELPPGWGTFRLVLREHGQYARVASAVANMPGVDQIVDENAMVAAPPR
jgi:hypothetical protein